MKATRSMDDELIVQKGVELLMNGLGPLDALRFMHLPRERRIESVKRHREWQRNLDQQQFFDKVFPV